MRNYVNQDTLFKGSYMVVARQAKEIKDKNTGNTSVYYEVGLSNGIKMISVTCGENHALVSAPAGKFYDMEFTVEERRSNNGALIQKLKVLEVIQPDSEKPKQ